METEPNKNDAFLKTVNLDPVNSSNLKNLVIPLNSNGSIPEDLHFGKNAVGNLSINAISDSQNLQKTKPFKFKIQKRNQIPKIERPKKKISIKELLKKNFQNKSSKPKSLYKQKQIENSRYIPR